MAVAAANTRPPQRTALVAGTNGLTGRALLRLMLRNADYDRVQALSRRPLPVEHPRLVNRILNHDELAARLAGTRCDDAFCCLGAAHGPRAAGPQLRHVDLELTLAFARAAHAAGAARLVVVSAAGAARDADSAFLHTKGELESALRSLPFAAVDILRPGLVVGDRPGNHSIDVLRQVLAPVVNLAMVGRFQDLRWISGADLAAAMLGAARGQRRGVNVYSGGKLQQLTTAGARAG